MKWNHIPGPFKVTFSPQYELDLTAWVQCRTIERLANLCRRIQHRTKQSLHKSTSLTRLAAVYYCVQGAHEMSVSVGGTRRDVPHIGSMSRMSCRFWGKRECVDGCDVADLVADVRHDTNC